MSDWFKFYENDLDEIRFQYAISKMPEVIPVFVGILSECCRHKSGTISWRDDAIELFGFARRLNISVPKVNEAINVLIEIRYIEKGEEQITVIKWDDKQSEYCQKLSKKQNQRGEKNPNSKERVRTVSGQAPESVGQEERRGEEKEENNNAPVVADKRMLALNACFNRRETTQWSTKELREYKRSAKIADGEDFGLLVRYYKSGFQYLRKDLFTLLHNWNGELDRAREWEKTPSSNPYQQGLPIAKDNPAKDLN